eukprot:GFUD01049243.1.p1 GENE.GFUD01049243.1~~GFUD01049243.1.p1  ORF type:complete len:296 (+),score=89.51 GFUD01049243.1:76-888(+)
MVKLQFSPPDKEDRTPILRTNNLPVLLPVTIKQTRKTNEHEKAMGLFSFLGSTLLFIGFLMILFSIKSVWDLKIENWRLVKENAALKKTVRDNISVEKFRNFISSEDDILEFERPVMVEPPDLSWSLSVQIFWSSPFITPCDMNWLARELSEQIYNKKKELNQERMEEIMEIQENEVNEILKMETENSQELDTDKVYEVQAGGPFLKSTEYLDLDNTMDDEELAEQEDEGYEIIQKDNISAEEASMEEMLIEEIEKDMDIEIKQDSDTNM